MPENNLLNNLIPSGTLFGQIAVGGGTTNYNDLENRPSINDVTLSGNKTTSDLGLFSGNYDDLSNKPVFTTWTYHGSILSETGIAASLTYNPVLKMAILRISGSNDKPLNTTYTFNLPNFCTPVMELQCYARYMAWLTVSTNRTVTIRGVDTNSNWQSGSILFPYN